MLPFCILWWVFCSYKGSEGLVFKGWHLPIFELRGDNLAVLWCQDFYSQKESEGLVFKGVASADFWISWRWLSILLKSGLWEEFSLAVCYLLSLQISTLLSYESCIPLRCPHRASNNKMSIRSFCFYAAMVRTFLYTVLEDTERYPITVCFGSARNIK